MGHDDAGRRRSLGLDDGQAALRGEAHGGRAPEARRCVKPGVAVEPPGSPHGPEAEQAGGAMRCDTYGFRDGNSGRR